jgi:hypothetical protein
MAIIVKSLGSGTLTVSGTATVYTVPASKSALINNLRLVNGNSSVSAALNLWVRPSGGASVSRRIYDKGFTLAASESKVIEDVVTLGQGDALQIELGNNTQSIGYMVNGIERE